MKSRSRFALVVVFGIAIIFISHFVLRVTLGEIERHRHSGHPGKATGLPHQDGTAASKHKNGPSAAADSPGEQSPQSAGRGLGPGDDDDGTSDDRSAENTAVVPYLNRDGRCHLRVLVYDKHEELGADKRPTLRDLAKRRVGGRWTADLRFRNNCSMRVLFGDDPGAVADLDAVVVHIIGDFVPRNRLVSRSEPRCKWIFFSWKPPEPQDAGFPADATWTYHRRADVRIPYGVYMPGRPAVDRRRSPHELVAGKTETVLWMASHCGGTTWPRRDLVRALQRHIPVHVYGKCGDRQCQPHWAPECMGRLLARYKFYLALENRECGDYITEKAWEKPLQHGVVPVVYGPSRRDYEALLPPGSFIHLADFGSVRELADYLRLLDGDPARYARYLEWRHNGSVSIPRKMFDSFPPSMFGDLFAVMDRLRREGRRRTALGKAAIYRTCRDQRVKMKHMTNGTYGVGTWFPW